MSFTDLDDDLDDVDDLTAEQADDSDLVRRLRRQLKQANKRSKKADELEAQIRTLAGEREIAKAGLDGLTERQQKTLLREVDGDVTADKLKEAAAELWPDRFAEQDPAEAEIDEHEAISQAGRGVQGKGGTEITPADFASWDVQRQRAFIKQHPDKVDALKKGEIVRGLTF